MGGLILLWLLAKILRGLWGKSKPQYRPTSHGPFKIWSLKPCDWHTYSASQLPFSFSRVRSNVNYEMEAKHFHILDRLRKRTSDLIENLFWARNKCLQNMISTTQARPGQTTGLGFITSHGLREYEVKKLRSPAFCGWRKRKLITQFHATHGK